MYIIYDRNIITILNKHSFKSNLIFKKSLQPGLEIFIYKGLDERLKQYTKSIILIYACVV